MRPVPLSSAASALVFAAGLLLSPAISAEQTAPASRLALHSTAAGTISAAPRSRDQWELAARKALRLVEQTSAEPRPDRMASFFDPLPNGAMLVRFQTLRQGIPVFQEDAAVLLNADGNAVATRTATIEHASHDRATTLPLWQLSAEHALALVADQLAERLPTSANPQQQGDWLRFGTGPHASRVKRTWFREHGSLRAAWYIEAWLRDTADGTTDLHGLVIDAADGRVLWQAPLQAEHAFTWRVLRDDSAPHRPLPGPQGRQDFPHPTGVPDGFVPTLDTTQDITLSSTPLQSLWPDTSFNDPWLNAGGLPSLGNNARVYADLSPPDGWNAGDVELLPTAADAFRPEFNPDLPPLLPSSQLDAALAQAFYTVNQLHDWFYVAGFNEPAGNGQQDNYGRGGLDNDAPLIEIHDFSGRNNANMATPSDGGTPRLQVMPWAARRIASLSLGSSAEPWPVIAADFGQTAFDLQAEVTLPAASEDGCTPLASPSAPVVLLRQAACNTIDQARHAADAGAIAVLIDTGADVGYPSLSDDGGLQPDLAVLGLRKADGDRLRQLIAQQATEVTLQRQTLPEPVASMDATLIAHEYGHFVSNRLIADGTGLSNLQGRSLGEGWADFHALLWLTQATDTNVDSNQDFHGSYAVMSHAAAGLQPAYSRDAAYFGIRRFPYSSDPAKNPLRFRHIIRGEALPEFAPRSPQTLSSDNAQVHNAGEVWASMLWDCYAALLRDSQLPMPRRDFDSTQRQMTEYLLGAYSLTPPQPTYIEARDALLAVIAASDARDLQLCGTAFAQRGAGLRAQAARRDTLSNIGLVESEADGGDLDIADVTLTPQVDCDADGFVDESETALLSFRVINSGTQALQDSRVDITTLSGEVDWLDPPTLDLPALAAREHVTVQRRVQLQSNAAPIELSFEITPDDGALPFETGLVRKQGWAAQLDVSPRGSSIERFDLAPLTWTSVVEPVADSPLDPEQARWRQRAESALMGHAHGPSATAAGASWLISPPIDVSPQADFSLYFEARHQFEADTQHAYDGGVIEVSLDNGQTWLDASTLASLSPAYNGEISDCCDNPGSGRPAYTGRSGEDTNVYVAHRLQFGRALEGQRVQLRFGVLSDAAVAAEGWHIDHVRLDNAVNAPFAEIIPNRPACSAGYLFSDRFESIY